MEHNHETSEIIYSAYPENRRVLMTETVEALLSCPGITNRDLKKHIQDSQGKVVLSSDIRNLKLKAGIQTPQRKRKSSEDLAAVEAIQANLTAKQEAEDPSDPPKPKPSARALERYIKNEVKRKKPKTEEEAKFITQSAMKFGIGNGSHSRHNGQTSFETPDGEKYTIIQLNNAEETDPDLEFFKGLLPQIKELSKSRRRDYFLSISSLLFQSLQKQEDEAEVNIKPNVAQVYTVSTEPHAGHTVVAMEMDPSGTVQTAYSHSTG